MRYESHNMCLLTELEDTDCTQLFQLQLTSTGWLLHMSAFTMVFLWVYMWGPTGHLIIRFMNNYVYCLMIRSGSFFLWLRMFQISPDLFFSFSFYGYPELNAI